VLAKPAPRAIRPPSAKAKQDAGSTMPLEDSFSFLLPLNYAIHVVRQPLDCVCRFAQCNAVRVVLPTSKESQTFHQCPIWLRGPAVVFRLLIHRQPFRV
jgi:hypothetical protein